MKTGRKKLLVLVNNHFDLLWRRCWRRRFSFAGRSFASYSEIEDLYLRDNLNLAERVANYKFEVESAAVLRNSLARHPEWKEKFVRLAREGRFAVSGSGENIIDANLVLGESIVRNFLCGLLWVERELGAKTSQGVRTDAFGNSAQLPQILLGCELSRVSGLLYALPRGTCWRGLDGSGIAIAILPEAGRAHGIAKLRPCPACGGSGCDSCEGTGIEPQRVRPPEREAIRADFPVATVAISPEELLPCLEIDEWAKRLGEEFDVEFALGEDTGKYLSADALRMDECNPSVELNPANTGCYVTRIRHKQECRRQEYETLGLETLCCAARLTGRPYPKEALTSLWRELLVTMFHDAVTGTHIDAAAAELEDIRAGIDRDASALRKEALAALTENVPGCVSAVNLRGAPFSGVLSAAADLGGASFASLTAENGRPVKVLSAEKLDDGRTRIDFTVNNLPPFSAECFQILPAPPPAGPRRSRELEIENGRFRILADAEGIRSIFDKKLRAELCTTAQYRPGEILLESDEGSPWATLKNSQERWSGNASKFTGTEKGDGWQSMSFDLAIDGWTFAGGSPFLGKLKVLLREGVERVDFELDVPRWDAFNARIRIAFPLPFPGANFCEIPYGTLRREPYAPDFSWTGANGDWPAVNWAGSQGPDFSVALFNKGTPSCKLEDERTLLLSVLRSPVIPTFLHEPWDYVMTDFQGMRDAGEHRFEFALTSYAGPFAASPVVDDAESYCAGAVAIPGRVNLPNMPTLRSDCARIAALKGSEEGDALIVRLFEFRGEGGEAVLSLPAEIASASKVNLLERCGTALPIGEGGEIRIPLRPWEIATIRCEFTGGERR